MMDDSILLRNYLAERSQAAFTELVQRHLPFVYRSALRQTEGNSALAEELTQATFVLLARKATSLMKHPTLAGWLHTTVYFAASEAKRSERRRRKHEQEATRMSELTELPGTDAPSPDWSRVQPLLDETLLRLDPRDRDAIILRFLENRPFGEIAARLAVKEDAARMRVNRALARLRDLLGARGIRSTEAALTTFLATEAAASGTISSIFSAAIATNAFATAQSAIAGGAWSSITLHSMQFMTTNKSIIVAAAISAAIGSIGTGAVMRHTFSRQSAALRSLQVENDTLRDRLAASLPANPNGAATVSSPRSTSPANPNDRLSAMNSQVRIREASRDALPTAVAHPLKFRGYDTPIAAVESFVWASYNSDAELLARSIFLDDKARAAIDKIRTSLSPESQAKYPTAESLVAMCIAYDVISHPGPNSEDIFVDPPQPNYIDADDFKTSNGQIYHLTAGGWKYSFPARGAGFVAKIINPQK